MAAPTRTSTRGTHRVPVTPAVAAGVVVVYVVVVFGLQLSTGLSYTEWVSTPGNALRAAVLPLAVGAVGLVAFARFSGWDLLWRDPARLPMTRGMTFFVVAIVVRLAGVTWGTVDVAMILVVLASGVLVGFAEELLFRGIVLRSLRTHGRTEARAALWTALGFGLFHLPNLLVGTGGAALAQLALAALSGAMLYLFRRAAAMIVPAMVAHGAWDASAFLTASNGSAWIPIASLGLVVLGVVFGVVAIVAVWRTDKHRVVTPAGVELREPAAQK